MGRIISNLERTLSEVGVTRNKVAVKAEIRPATLADMVNDRSRSLNYQTATAILDAINAIAAEQGSTKVYGITDIIEYVHE
jgi:predicted transcriptional regulator